MSLKCFAPANAKDGATRIMLEKIARLFRGDTSTANAPVEPRLAVAALLIHLATVDGVARPQELKAIAVALKTHYELDDATVAKLIETARQKDREAVDFYQFTSKLAQLEQDEKIAIIGMMWQVVFADDSNHELEDNMVWRVAELIGVSARERTILRNRMRHGEKGTDATLAVED